MITEDRSMTILIILIMAESRREGMGNAPRRQADRSTRAHAQVHRKLLYGHQGIRYIAPHLREPACLMGPHGYRLTCFGGSLLVPAPHSLRQFGAVG